MKKTAFAISLGLLFAMSCYAQQPTTNSAPTFPPPTPLSRATLDKLSKMTPIFDGKTLDGWKASVKGTNATDVSKAWTVQDGAMSSLGQGRGVLHTEKVFGNYRLILTMRHLGGPPSDHRA